MTSVNSSQDASQVDLDRSTEISSNNTTNTTVEQTAGIESVKLTGVVTVSVKDLNLSGKTSLIDIAIEFVERSQTKVNETKSVNGTVSDTQVYYPAFVFTGDYEVEPESRPGLSIAKIDRYGTCTIKFNSTMVVQEELLA